MGISHTCLGHFGKYFIIITQQFLSRNMLNRNVYTCLPVHMSMSECSHALFIISITGTTELFISSKMNTRIFACLSNGILQSNEKENYRHMQQQR